jgi:hypothetical protein
MTKRKELLTPLEAGEARELSFTLKRILYGINRQSRRVTSAKRDAQVRTNRPFEDGLLLFTIPEFVNPPHDRARELLNGDGPPATLDDNMSFRLYLGAVILLVEV